MLSDALLSNCGALVLCFLAHFRRHKLATDKMLYDRLRNLVESNPHAGAFWPLTLELVHLDEADPKWNVGVTPHALRCQHDAKVSIIDWNALPRVFAETPADDGDNGPDYAIEDYGADYGEGTGGDNDDEDDEE